MVLLFRVFKDLLLFAGLSCHGIRCRIGFVLQTAMFVLFAGFARALFVSADFGSWADVWLLPEFEVVEGGLPIGFVLHFLCSDGFGFVLQILFVEAMGLVGFQFLYNGPQNSDRAIS